MRWSDRARDAQADGCVAASESSPWQLSDVGGDAPGLVLGGRVPQAFLLW
jgi:hypothetical protein